MRHAQPQPPSLYTASGQRKYLTAQERARLLAAAANCTNRHLATLCMTLAHTGCRVSEALALTAGSVEPLSGFIAIRSLKKRGGIVVREVPVPPDLVAMLAQVHGIGRSPLSMRLWPWARGTAWRLVKAMMREAGIAEGPPQSPKGLRHSFGVHAIRSGVPLNLVQRWLGHASMNTTAIYLQVMGDEERAIASRMWSPQVRNEMSPAMMA